MLACCAPSQLTAQLTSGLIFSSTTQPIRPALGMPHMINLLLAYLLANLASSAGVYSFAAQSAVPRAEADTFRSGNIVTFVGGLCSR
jgi:hypothetical protein